VLSALLRPWFEARSLAEASVALGGSRVLWAPFRHFTDVVGDLRGGGGSPVVAELAEDGFGVTLNNVTAQVARRLRLPSGQTGAVVTEVDPDSAAAGALRQGDVILAVNGDKITSQTGFYRKLWSLGTAGVDVPLTVYHEGVTFDVVLSSTDRARLLKAPRLH
jgi:predicted metalloprotease with PDZ domain